jgi:hypothetical protein
MMWPVPRASLGCNAAITQHVISSEKQTQHDSAFFFRRRVRCAPLKIHIASEL